MPFKKIIRVILITLAILAIPLIGMQVGDEVNWSLGDFVGMGILIAGFGLLYEFIAARLKSGNQRLILAGVLLLAFLTLWVELAVGIFD